MTDSHCWMRLLPDSVHLSALSIPGTHNSPTCYRALPSVRCQAVSVISQLRNGVRFLDIRVQPDHPNDPTSDSLTLVHSAFPISLGGSKKTLHLVLDTVRAFLHDNHSETIIMSLKREGTGSATDAHLCAILHRHYISPEPELWYTEPRVPSLGEARGKIVLMRRFALSATLRGEWAGRGWGLHAENWPANAAACSYGDVCVQDFFEVMRPDQIADKIQLCCDHVTRAGAVSTFEVSANPDATPHPAPLYLNFLSASNFWNPACWPERIAAKLNPALTAFLGQEHGVECEDRPSGSNGGVGILVCDWVGKDGDWDLVRCIVSMNSRLLLQDRDC